MNRRSRALCRCSEHLSPSLSIRLKCFHLLQIDNPEDFHVNMASQLGRDRHWLVVFAALGYEAFLPSSFR